MNSKYLHFLLLTYILLSCKSNNTESSEEVQINNFNFIIAPDLSNRITDKHPKPIHDTVIINSIFNHIKSDFLKIGNRQANQKDSYIVDFINPGVLSNKEFKLKASDFEINFEKFGNSQIDRSNYIRNQLAKDILKQKQNISYLYKFSKANLSGADIYNYLNKNVNNFLKDEPCKTEKVKDNLKAKLCIQNVVILLTDGYIENSSYDGDNKLTSDQVKEIREAYKKSQEIDIYNFIKNNSKYHINKLNNKKLASANILVLELDDRSLDKDGVAIFQPTDSDIIKAIWKVWFEESGVKKYDFIERQNTSEQVSNEIKKFVQSI